MKKLLIILSILFSFNASSQQPPIGVLYVGQAGWQYYRTITLDQPAGDLTDFPVLVAGTYAYLATTANGGNVTNASGYDIAFFSDAGLTTMLKFEREQYVAATGQVTYWVKIPTLTSASATVIYMAYGNTSITTSQADVANTWRSSYVGVYHLPDGTTLTSTDATANNYDADPYSAPTAQTGKIYGGLGGSYLTVADQTAFTLSSGGTIECWFYKTALGAGTMIDKTTSSVREIMSGILSDNTILFWMTDSTNSSYVGRRAPSTSYSLNTWHYAAFVYDGGATNSSCKIYIDGVQVDNSDIGSGGFTSVRNTVSFLNIKKPSSGLGAELTGTMDEVRISNVTHSSDWLLTQFNSMNDPSTFYVVGSAVSL